jgi:hypothetical protein
VIVRQLILIHGRAQENKDAAGIKKEWIAAWEKGLNKSNLTNPLADSDIHFPYYGDTLAQMVAGKTAEQAAAVIIKGPKPSPAEEQIMRDMIAEIAAESGISEAEIRAQLGAEGAAVAMGPQNWRWVQAILELLDKNDTVSAKMVALVTNDVAKYLSDSTIHNHINDGVLQGVKPGQEAVVVAHSLGTVVAYDVLMSRPTAFPAVKVPLFVTLGSPLGITAIKTRLRPHTFPKPVTKWFNALDKDDVVSLYPLTPAHFATGGTIENYDAVDNWTDNQHSIGGYLDDQRVARKIFDALTA